MTVIKAYLNILKMQGKLKHVILSNYYDLTQEKANKNRDAGKMDIKKVKNTTLLVHPLMSFSL